MVGEWQRNGYLITTDSTRMDPRFVRGSLKRTYWAEGVSEENVRRRIENSLVFGLYDGEEQVGFARVVTDYATLAYLTDVFVAESHRNRGLGRWLVEVVLSNDELEGLKWLLATKDAHYLYRGYGFAVPKHPEWIMERLPSVNRVP